MNPVHTQPTQTLPVNASNLRKSVTAFAAQAGRLADQILSIRDQREYNDTAVIRHHHYHHGYSYWSPFYLRPSPVVVIDGGRSERRRRSEDNAAVAIIAAIVGGIALYTIGSSMAQYQDASTDHEENMDMQYTLNQYQGADVSMKDRELIGETYQALRLKDRITTRIQNSASEDLVMRVGLFAGAGVAFMGAISAAPALITAGTITGLVACGGMLFKWGLDSTNRANIRDAEALAMSLDRLKSL